MHFNMNGELGEEQQAKERKVKKTRDRQEPYMD
jgi:hypothetical protein